MPNPDHPGRRDRDDQWIARMRQPSGVRERTMSSTPVLLIARSRKVPVVSLDDTAQATSPASVTLMGPRREGTARANPMSAGR